VIPRYNFKLLFTVLKWPVTFQLCPTWPNGPIKVHTCSTIWLVYFCDLFNPRWRPDSVYFASLSCFMNSSLNVVISKPTIKEIQWTCRKKLQFNYKQVFFLLLIYLKARKWILLYRMTRVMWTSCNNKVRNNTICLYPLRQCLYLY
jgi:hypothetical protein